MATDPNTITDDRPAEQLAEEVRDDGLYPDDGAQADEASTGAEDGEQQDAVAELDPIDPPTSWAKDAKELFAGLPREAQEVIAKREGERDRFVQQKAQEAANTRQTVENEARQVILQVHRAQAEQLQRYAQMFEPQQPDIRLLQSGDEQHRALYYQLDAEYRSATAQREQAQREAQAAEQQATALEQQQQQAENARELALLAEKIPEWSDPSQRPKLLEELQSIGTELGYSSEQMSQARAADILALKTASEWKRKALKYDQLNKAKMIPVRQAKTLPPAARGSAPAGLAQRQPVDLAASLYPNDVRR